MWLNFNRTDGTRSQQPFGAMLVEEPCLSSVHLRTKRKRSEDSGTAESNFSPPAKKRRVVIQDGVESSLQTMESILVEELCVSSVKPPTKRKRSEDSHTEESIFSPPAKKRRTMIQDGVESSPQTTDKPMDVGISTATNRRRPMEEALGVHGSPQKSQEPSKKKIWIIGSSYVRRGEGAAQQIFGSNLGLDAQVCWFGKGGMRWEGVLPCFYSELSTQHPPDILVVHAGGNNMGLTSASELVWWMKRDLVRLHKEFPSMKILFSTVNERQQWRHGSLPQIIRDRNTVNNVMRNAADSFGGEVIEHPHLRFYRKSLFIADGVHFSTAGNKLFLSSIRTSLQKTLTEAHHCRAEM